MLILNSRFHSLSPYLHVSVPTVLWQADECAEKLLCVVTKETTIANTFGNALLIRAEQEGEHASWGKAPAEHKRGDESAMIIS